MGFNGRDFLGTKHPAGTVSDEQLFHLRKTVRTKKIPKHFYFQIKALFAGSSK
jgi:hypothetical protein